jgi:hypothetical protein
MTLYSPKTHPRDYGFKKGDFHVVLNAASGTAKAYTFEGVELWEIPCLLKGQDERFWVRGGNTCPGVYVIGQVWRDKENGEMTPAYGWIVFDLVDKEGREDGNGRSGLAVHGGGTGLPDPYAPYQELIPTLGCSRWHNEDLLRLDELVKTGGTVFISVFQTMG